MCNKTIDYYIKELFEDAKRSRKASSNMSAILIIFKKFVLETGPTN